MNQPVAFVQTNFNTSPSRNTKKKIAITGLILIFLGIFGIGSYMLSKNEWVQNLINKNNSSNEIAEIKVIKKVASLKENKNKEVAVPIGDSQSAVKFAPGTLSEEFTNNYQVETTRTMIEPVVGQLAQFSLNLKFIGTKDTGVENNTDNLPSILEFSPQAVETDNNYALLEYDYSELAEEYAPSSLRFNYFNNTSEQWEELPTDLDRNTSKISAKIKHFSEYSVTGQTAQHFAPTLKNWETNLYTGSVSYSVGIDVVPGIGGLSPSLTATYNSNRANNLSHEDKGSWIGPGWDLAIPEIRFDNWGNNPRDPANTCEDPMSREKGPQYSLIIGGTEEPLFWFKSSGCANNICQSSNFISKSGKITAQVTYGTYNGQTGYTTSGCQNSQGRGQIITKWEVTDTSGTKYFFDALANPNSVADRWIQGSLAPSKFMVTKIQDLSGNIINFSYVNDTVPGIKYPKTSHNLAVYLKEINYNHGLAKIVFTTGLKSSQPVSSVADDKNFEKQRLNKIQVISDTSLNTIYRTYVFNYDTTNYKFKYATGSETQAESETYYDVLINIEKYNGIVDIKNKLITETFNYEMRLMGHSIEYLSDSDYVPTNFHSWDDLSNMINSGSYDDGDGNYHNGDYLLKASQRRKLKRAGFGDCKSDYYFYRQNYPNRDESRPNCPALAYGNIYYNGAQGVRVSWEKGKAPFIKNIVNGYGGKVDITYDTLWTYDPIKYSFVRNVVKTKTIYDTSWDENKRLKEEYIYEATPFSQKVRPNAGGGFGRVTLKDPVTGMMTTTYYYPLSAENNIEQKHALLNPDKNPFYGLPMRTVTHRYEGDKDRIYSDQFTSYSFIPAYNPAFGLDTAIASKTIDNAMNNAVGSAVTVVSDSFQPREANYIEIAKNDQTPQNISDTDRSKFIHNQSRTWYDRYGFPTKTASFGDVSGFLSGINYDLNTARISDKKWYEKDLLGNWYAKQFTYNLPMVSYLYYGGTANNPVFSGAPNSDPNMNKYSYSKYLRNADYDSRNIYGLVAESIVSDVDSASFDGVAQDKRYQWSQITYDEDGKKRGLATTQKTINTQKPSDRLVSPDELITKSVYDNFGNVIEQTDARWNSSDNGGIKTVTTLYSDNAYANILPREIKSVDKAGKELSKTNLTFNSKWQVETETDINGTVAKAEYDCIGRPQKIYKPDVTTGAISSTPSTIYKYYDYQADGCGMGEVGNSPNIRSAARISSLTSDDNWANSDTILDGLGNQRQNIVIKTKIDNALKSMVSETIYNNRGLKEQETMGIEIAQIDLNQPPAYQNLNLPTCNTSHPNATCYGYDELGRTVAVTDPLGNVSANYYRGIYSSSTDANNTGKTNPTQTVQTVNALGQVKKTEVKYLGDTNNPSYGLVSYNDYDVMGNVVKTTTKKCSKPDCTSSGNVETELYASSTSYDGFGRKWKIIDPDLGTWKMAYDSSGNILSQLDAKNQTINFKYDGAGRLLEKIYPGNPRGGLAVGRNNILNYYDRDGQAQAGQMIGKLWKMEDPTGYVQYRYDKRGRVLEEKKVISKILTGGASDEETVTTFEYYESDAVKNTTITQNGKQVEKITNELNELGQTEKIKGETGYYLNSQTYSRFGTPSKSILGNNDEVGIDYDSIGRMTRKYVLGVSTYGTGMNYLYNNRDRVGNILNIKNDVAGGFQYGYAYDRLYQLKSATGYGKDVSYIYDEEGNIVSKNEAKAVTLEYGGAGPRHAPKKVNGVTYTYDANGNILEDELRKYTWDFDNKPIKIEFKDGSVVSEFAYDGGGNRVLKKVNKKTTGPTPTPVTPPPSADLDGNGSVGASDIVKAFTNWGTNTGQYGANTILLILNNWTKN